MAWFSDFLRNFAAGIKKRIRRLKRIFLIILTAFCTWTAQAQKKEVSFEKADSVAFEPIDSVVMAPIGFSLPPLTMRGTIAHYPYYNGVMGFYDWELHPGLNASLSASAIFGLGSNAGSGFANSIALAYANSITPKLSFSIGGYSSYLDYSNHVMKDAGLTAMLNYRFDEHWEAALFAQKSIVQPRIVMPNLYWMSDIGDKIGASVRYHFNPQFSVGLSVWKGNTPSQHLFR